MSRTLGAVGSGATRQDEITTTFGVSGYLTQSDVLLYDRASETLWSQIDGRGVAGPRAGQELEFVPVIDTTWKDWVARYPAARVLRGPLAPSDYSDPYAHYHASDRLLFRPSTASDLLKSKAHVFGVRVGAASVCYSLDTLLERAHSRDAASRDEPLTWTIAVGETSLEFVFRPTGPSLSATRRASTPTPPVADNSDAGTSTVGAPQAERQAVPVLRMYWFAWFTFHPKTQVDPPEEPPPTAESDDPAEREDSPR